MLIEIQIQRKKKKHNILPNNIANERRKRHFEHISQLYMPPIGPLSKYIEEKGKMGAKGIAQVINVPHQEH